MQATSHPPVLLVLGQWLARSVWEMWGARFILFPLRPDHRSPAEWAAAFLPDALSMPAEARGTSALWFYLPVCLSLSIAFLFHVMRSDFPLGLWGPAECPLVVCTALLHCAESYPPLAVISGNGISHRNIAKKELFPPLPAFLLTWSWGDPVGPPSRAGAQGPPPQQCRRSAFIVFISSEKETEVPRGVVA